MSRKKKGDNTKDILALIGGDIQINDADVDDELNDLLDEVNGGGKNKGGSKKAKPAPKAAPKPAPKASPKPAGKEAPNQKAQPAKPAKYTKDGFKVVETPEDVAELFDQADALLGDFDENAGVDVDSDDLAELDGLEEDDLDALEEKLEKPKPKQKTPSKVENDEDEKVDAKTSKTKRPSISIKENVILSSDDEENENAEEATPQKSSKPKASASSASPVPKTNARSTQPVKKPTTKSTYEQVFDYFSGTFYNFLLAADDPTIAADYMERINDLVPLVFNGEEGSIPKKMQFLTLPSPTSPFGRWQNVKNKEIQVKSRIQETRDINKVLQDQKARLTELKKAANSARDENTVREIDRALQLTNGSIHKMTNPQFLVSDFITIAKSNVDTTLSDKDFQITLLSIEGGKSKSKVKISFEIPIVGQILFQTETNKKNINNSITKNNYDTKKAVAKFQTSGKVTIDKHSTEFSLTQLYSKSSVEESVIVNGIKITFQMGIRTPLDGEKIVYSLEEFVCSPLLLTEAISCESAPKYVYDHTPKEKPKPKQKQIAGTQNVPKPTRNAQPNNGIPEYRLLSKEEHGLFWGTKVTEFLINQSKVLMSIYRDKKLEIPQPLVDQNTAFSKKMEEFMQAQENGELDPNEYLGQLEQAIKRETEKLPSLTVKEQGDRKAFINMLKSEYEEIKEMLENPPDDDE
ncbi:hypothetical protein TRFO_27048 [Tritrichomonas foetus]|uniref:Uncharacterized protein n=1 Tax=Tritrichomonas foetus TaxID=1144522 RepID=A0A1J4K2T9_9EUKA|nr:hypothetical protein TRFO_27048 [Tritrichomonas foetus]|eukprot:OHT05282.1 hypothetical protein TRFO_27048 [Tritrichomonas foetus]